MQCPGMWGVPVGCMNVPYFYSPIFIKMYCFTRHILHNSLTCKTMTPFTTKLNISG